MIGSYRDLDLWLVSMDMVDEVRKRVKSLPRDEFDLKRQIKSAAISIPSNVAEGWCRKDRQQAYQNHISIAMGSGGELDTELEVCFRNNLLRREECKEITNLLGRGETDAPTTTRLARSVRHRTLGTRDNRHLPTPIVYRP